MTDKFVGFKIFSPVEMEQQQKSIKKFFETLCEKESAGVNITQFLTPLYGLQNHKFVLWDAVKCFNLSNGSGTPTLDIVEFRSALTKVAKLIAEADGSHCTANNDNTSMLRNLISEIASVDSDNGTSESSLHIKTQMVQEKTLRILSAYSQSLVTSFQRFSKHDKMNIEQAIDYFSEYRLFPEYFSEADVATLVALTKQDFPTKTTLALRSDEIIFPQFLQLLCQTSKALHDTKVSRQSKNIRNSIESMQIDYCLSQMFKNCMGLTEKNHTSSAAPQQHRRRTSKDFGTFNEIMLGFYDVLGIEVPVNVPSNTSNCVLVREVVEFPDSFPADVIYKITSGLKYHNSDEYEMALASFAEARDTLKTQSLDTRIYFCLLNASVHESQRRDTEALKLYTEAHDILIHDRTDLEEGSYEYYGPLVYSCLGCAAYYSGHSSIAAAFYEKALEIRSTEDDESRFEDEIGTTLNNLGCCAMAKNLKEDGHIYLQRAYTMLQASLGTAHPRTGVCLKNLQRSKTRFGAISKTGLDEIRGLRQDSQYIIPGGRFQINALVPTKGAASKSTKKKKKGGKKKK